MTVKNPHHSRMILAGVYELSIIDIGGDELVLMMGGEK